MKNKIYLVLGITGIIIALMTAGGIITYGYMNNNYAKYNIFKKFKEKKIEKELITSWVNKNGSKAFKGYFSDTDIQFEKKLLNFLDVYAKQQLLPKVALSLDYKHRILVTVNMFNDFSFASTGDKPEYKNLSNLLKKENYFSKNFNFLCINKMPETNEKALKIIFQYKSHFFHGKSYPVYVYLTVLPKNKEEESKNS